MAAMNEEQVYCAICLDMFNDPVTIPCGHSYCIGCITDFWDQANQWILRCPQCRRSFDVRPELNRNTVLADLVEKLREIGFLHCPPKSSRPSDGVGCDVCSGNILPAVKSCLVCLASYCELHVQPHFKSPAFKKHKLVTACAGLQQKICSVHDRLYEFFCRTDQACVCYLCTMRNHEGHDIVTAEIARAEKGEELTRLVRTLNQRIQQREKVSQDLNKAVKNIKRYTQETCREVEQISTELLTTIKKKYSEVMELLQAQEKAELRVAEGLHEQVELEIADLRKTTAELDKTLDTNDHIDFLQSYLSLKCPSEPEAFDVPNPCHKFTFKKVVQFVSKLQKILENICGTEISNISETKPKTRDDFLHYSCYLTLESVPGHPNLCVKEDNRSVEWVARGSSGSLWPVVLCREGLTGRCYWEAQWSGTGICTVGLVEGRGSSGEALRSGFGRDALSWGLNFFHLSCVFSHGGDSVTVAVPREANTVGVYLDHRAGILSFYSVSNEMTLLHRAQARFTQPLYPGFAIWANAWQIPTDSGFFGKCAITSEQGHMSAKLINL